MSMYPKNMLFTSESVTAEYRTGSVTTSPTQFWTSVCSVTGSFTLLQVPKPEAHAPSLAVLHKEYL